MKQIIKYIRSAANVADENSAQFVVPAVVGLTFIAVCYTITILLS